MDLIKNCFVNGLHEIIGINSYFYEYKQRKNETSDFDMSFNFTF